MDYYLSLTKRLHIATILSVGLLKVTTFEMFDLYLKNKRLQGKKVTNSPVSPMSAHQDSED